MSDSSRADPGPTDSAVAAGSGESAVGSGLESLAKKVGSALVSGSSEPLNQIQAYDEEKIGEYSFSAVTAAAAADSVPAAAAAPAPASVFPSKQRHGGLLEVLELVALNKRSTQSRAPFGSVLGGGCTIVGRL